jgi:hypothetical protein
MNRHQLALECVKIEKTGGSVRDFLRQQGCISPWGTWYRLQREELGRTDAQITEGKGDESMKQIRLTDDQKAQAVKIAIAGGDPRNYLRDCGSKAPDVMWQSIRAKIMAEDPETYEKLPKRIPRVGKKKQEVELVYDPSIAEEYRQEQAEDAGRKEPEPGNVPDLKLKAIAAEGIAGRWTTDGKMIRLRNSETNDSIADMTPLEWEAAAAELPEVLRLFGMEAGYGLQKLCD